MPHIEGPLSLLARIHDTTATGQVLINLQILSPWAYFKIPFKIPKTLPTYKHLAAEIRAEQRPRQRRHACQEPKEDLERVAQEGGNTEKD